MATTVAAEPVFEVTPFAGYRAGGQFRDAGSGDALDLSDGSGVALALNWRASEPGTQYELLYSRQSTDTGGATPVDLKIEYLQLGGTTVIGEDTGRVVPFAAGGIGAARFTPSPVGLSQETRWSFNLGGGVRIPLARHVRLRFEARGYLTWLGGNANLFCDGGCTIVAKGKSFFQYEALGGVSIGF
ncbi:MAG: outer membrane beta-barrel protein [Steroidobacteraceae bacterium]